MEIVEKIPQYDGMWIDLVWDEGSAATVQVQADLVIIRANRKGLRSLAKQMLYLGCNDVLEYAHVHYETWLPSWKGKALIMTVCGETLSLFDRNDTSTQTFTIPEIQDTAQFSGKAYFAVSIGEEVCLQASQSGFFQLGLLLESMYYSMFTKLELSEQNCGKRWNGKTLVFQLI